MCAGTYGQQQKEERSFGFFVVRFVPHDPFFRSQSDSPFFLLVLSPVGCLLFFVVFGIEFFLQAMYGQKSKQIQEISQFAVWILGYTRVYQLQRFHSIRRRKTMISMRKANIYFSRRRLVLAYFILSSVVLHSLLLLLLFCACVFQRLCCCCRCWHIVDIIPIGTNGLYYKNLISISLR